MLIRNLLERRFPVQFSEWARNNLPENSSIDTFAFAYWGGSLFIFMRTYGLGNSTNIVMENIGFNVIGAGVSTCAPTQ